MPANSTGWFWHALARETGRLGHLYSPGAQCGPWPWFPYALDNGAFACWDMERNVFNHEKWQAREGEWRRLLFWAIAAPIRPLWAIAPDVPGDAAATIERWPVYAPIIASLNVPLAIAVQDGMTPTMVHALSPVPDVIAIGGTTDWKWSTVEDWCNSFTRVHVLRCNSPTRLDQLDALGCESCDGTGWNRGDRRQTAGLEAWARRDPTPTTEPLWPHTCRRDKTPKQLRFA